MARALLDRRHVSAAISARVRRRRFLLSVHPADGSDLVLLGGDAGGWVIPLRALTPSSVCYLVGIGHDISLELELARRVGCRMHSFDPVPEALAYAHDAAAGHPEIAIHPVGVWSSDATLVFHRPARHGHVSYSAVDLHGTEPGFRAPVRSVVSLMCEFGDDHLDLLKLSAEGAEYAILEHVLEHRVPVGTLCVEFSQPAQLRQIRAAVDNLQRANFRLVNVRIDSTGWGWHTTFVSERAAR